MANTKENLAKTAFKKGHDPRRNTTGENRGHRSFESDFNHVCEKIAKQNKISFSDAREQLMLVGYKMAKEGSFSFWEYIHSHLYGKPQANLDVKLSSNIPADVKQKVADAIYEHLDQGGDNSGV